MYTAKTEAHTADTEKKLAAMRERARYVDKYFRAQDAYNKLNPWQKAFDTEHGDVAFDPDNDPLEDCKSESGQAITDAVKGGVENVPKVGAALKHMFTPALNVAKDIAIAKRTHDVMNDPRSTAEQRIAATHNVRSGYQPTQVQLDGLDPWMQDAEKLLGGFPTTTR